MEDITEHVVKRVLPDVGIRQWVLSLPFDHRGRVAFDKKLFGTVVRIFMDEVFRSYCTRARAFGIASPECGVIAFLQRFGAKLSLNGHVHAVVLDGVYAAPTVVPPSDPSALEPPGPELQFHPLPPPTPKDIEEVSSRVAIRAEGVLARRRCGPAAKP